MTPDANLRERSSSFAVAFFHLKVFLLSDDDEKKENFLFAQRGKIKLEVEGKKAMDGKSIMDQERPLLAFCLRFVVGLW